MATRNLNLQARMSMAPGAGGYHPPSSSTSQVKQKQMAQLNTQLAQLRHNLSNTEQLMTVTAVQAEHMRVLGSWHSGMFMSASKILGEESVGDAEGK